MNQVANINESPSNEDNDKKVDDDEDENDLHPAKKLTVEEIDLSFAREIKIPDDDV